MRPRTIGGALALLLAGCSNLLAPRPDHTRYYFLSSAAPTPVNTTKARPDTSIVGLGPLRLPDYLSRTERAVRIGPNQMRFVGNDRWAAALDANIASVLVQDLDARLANTSVVSLPTLSPARRIYDIPLEILQFDSTTTGDAELRARWTIKDASNDRILFTGETQLHEPSHGGGTEAAVAALSRILDRWSAEIAAAVSKLAAAPAPAVDGAKDGTATTRPAAR